MLTRFLLSFTTIFVALDVIGNVPIYLSITKSMAADERKKIVNLSMIVAFIVAVLFLFTGQKLFTHLGIGISDFKIAGGLILLLIALADLVGGPESHQKTYGSSGIVPLAVPLISGPAVLTTLILSTGTTSYLITIAALIANYIFAWAVLRHCDRVTRVLGKDGTVALSKIAALLLAAIAVAMIRGGVFDALNDWMRARPGGH